MRIKKGDQVLVTTGKEIGKRGKVLQVLPGKGRVVVERLNLIKKHTKANQKMQQGGIVEKEAPLHISNLLLVCSKCEKGVRIGYRQLEDKRKVRICKSCGEEI